MGIVTFSPKQDGTGDPSPTNVRPIHPGLVLKSKNLFNVNVPESLPSDTSSSNTAKRIFTPNTLIVGTSGTNYFAPNSASYSINEDILTINTKSGYGIGYAFRLIQGETYTINYRLGSNEYVTVGVSSYAQDGTFTQITSAAGNGEDFIVPNDSDIILLTIKAGSGSYEKDINISNIQLELGSTPTEYEPYYDMEIYGGYVDFDSGELVKEWDCVYASTLYWQSNSESSNGCFTGTLPYERDNSNSFIGIICDRYKTIKHNISITNMDNYSIKGHEWDGARTNLYLRDNNYTDISDFRQNVEALVVYKLLDSVTHSLTASQLTQAYNQLIPVSPVMLARRRRMMLTSELLIPPEYQLCDYLENNDGYNSRIDTGVSGDDETLRITGVFMPITISGNYFGVFGNYQTENDHYCWRCILQNSTYSGYNRGFYVTMGNGSPGGGGTEAIYPVGSDETMANVKIYMDMTYGKCTMIGTVTTTVTKTYMEKTTNANNIVIGASKVTGTGGTAVFHYYTFKMWSHGKLIRDYRPCVRKSDNKAGFYDMVNHTFNPSIGTADFIAGND